MAARWAMPEVSPLTTRRLGLPFKNRRLTVSNDSPVVAAAPDARNGRGWPLISTSKVVDGRG